MYVRENAHRILHFLPQDVHSLCKCTERSLQRCLQTEVADSSSGKVGWGQTWVSGLQNSVKEISVVYEPLCLWCGGLTAGTSEAL